MASNERKNARVASGRVNTDGTIEATDGAFTAAAVAPVGIIDITLVDPTPPDRRVVTHSSSSPVYFSQEDPAFATDANVRLYLRNTVTTAIDANGPISFKIERVS